LETNKVGLKATTDMPTKNMSKLSNQSLIVVFFFPGRKFYFTNTLRYQLTRTNIIRKGGNIFTLLIAIRFADGSTFSLDQRMNVHCAGEW
jgi:hypothetical protein